MPLTLDQKPKDWRKTSLSAVTNHTKVGQGRDRKGKRNRTLHGRKGANPKLLTTQEAQKPDPGAETAIERANRQIDLHLAELKDLVVSRPDIKDFLTSEKIDVDLFEQDIDELLESAVLPEFVVFTTTVNEERPDDFFDDITPLIERLENQLQRSYLVIVFAEPSPMSLKLTSKLFSHYQHIKGRVEVAHDLGSLENELKEAFSHAVADWSFEPQSLLHDARTQLRGIEDLYSDGKPTRLCAKKVSKAFGLTNKSLARVLSDMLEVNVTPAALSATPDSERLQSALREFERIARLQTVMTEGEFQAWLGAENWHLDNISPKQCLLEGDADVVAGLASSILLGNPS